MDLLNFKDELIKHLQEEGYWAVISKAEKINYQNQDTIIVKETAKDVVGISYPLSELYASYCMNYNMDLCISRLTKALINMNEESIHYFMDRISPEYLTLHVCDIDTNRELLSKSACFEVTPTIAAVAYIDIPTGNGNASIRISDNMLSQLGMTKKEALDRSISNLENSQFHVKHIGEVVKEMLGKKVPFIDRNEMPLYVVTNSLKMQGANILATKKALNEAVLRSVGEDCYILPSSIHEVILVPKSSGMDVASLKNMVESVNEAELNTREKLSDNVFEYSLSDMKLSLATGEEKENTKVRGRNICRI